MGITSPVMDGKLFCKGFSSAFWLPDVQELIPETIPVAVAMAETLMNSLRFSFIK